MSLSLGARRVYDLLWDHIQDHAVEALTAAFEDDRSQGKPLTLYDIAVCPKCWETYVVSKWPHRCTRKPGGV